MLLSLVFPACGQEGANGLPAAVPIELTQIVRPATPNVFLAAPAGFTPVPDMVTDIKGEPDQLYAIVRRVILAQPRVFAHGEFTERRQLHVVARSASANFPDLIMASVTPEGRLVLWSRSVYGRKDFGANAARVSEWMAAIARAAAAP